MKRVMLFLISFIFLSGCLCNKAHFNKENIVTPKENIVTPKEDIEKLKDTTIEASEESKIEPESESKPEQKEETTTEEYKDKNVLSESESKEKERIEDTEVYFAFDSSELTEKGREIIKEYANELKRKGYEEIMIEGHTDSIGTEVYNQKLSERRAESVKRELEKNGIDAERIKAVGYGETRPIADNKTKEGRAQNRRVEIKVR